MSQHVSVILRRKGSEVATIAPDARVSAAVATLAEQNVGALVVSGDGRRVDGILSERDIVRDLASMGPECLDRPVGEVMTDVVATCGRDATLDELMAMMTDKRIRHVPVVEDGALVGIVSIGDVVKSRLDELEVQAETLEQYVTGSQY